MKVVRSHGRNFLIAGVCIEVDARKIRACSRVTQEVWKSISVGHINDKGWLQVEPQMDTPLPPEKMIHDIDADFYFLLHLPFDRVHVPRPIPLHCGHGGSFDDPLDVDGRDEDGGDTCSNSNKSNGSNTVKSINNENVNGSPIYGHVAVSGVVHDHVQSLHPQSLCVSVKSELCSSNIVAATTQVCRSLLMKTMTLFWQDRGCCPCRLNIN